MSLSGHQSARAKSVDWLTPPRILCALGAFDTDPCCPTEMPWKTADAMLTPEIDGLCVPWLGRVWMNPPFGAAAGIWMKRLADHGNGIALIPARTETEMFFRSVWPKASSVLFIRRRPHFHVTEDTTFTSKGRTWFVKRGEAAPFNSGAPICLVGYGKRNDRALEDSGLGQFIRLERAA